MVPDPTRAVLERIKEFFVEVQDFDKATLIRDITEARDKEVDAVEACFLRWKIGELERRLAAKEAEGDE